MPIRTYTNWNIRASDVQEQIEPFRKYFFICEGANTETFYFRKLIDIRKQLDIHQMIDLRLLEKTDEHRDLSYPQKLLEFAELQKAEPALEFDIEHDKMVIVFDADIFEKKVPGYDDLIKMAEENGNIIGITNPNFEVFLLLHLNDIYESHIKEQDDKFFTLDANGCYSYPYNLLRDLTGMNSKKNSRIGGLAENVQTAIEQERFVNQDVHNAKGKITSNIASIIESIINDKPEL